MARKTGKRARANRPPAVRRASLLDAFAQITGAISYPTDQTSTLREADRRLSLLVMDVPPLGLFDVTDIAAAADLFRNLLRVPEGATVSVVGERGLMNGQPIIKVVRTDRLIGGLG